MSTKLLPNASRSKTPNATETTHYREKTAERLNISSSTGSTQIQKVWCAPMSEAGEWVVTWTSTPGAGSYEVQNSLDGVTWSSSSKFSGTRAVLFLGPVRRCLVRVRAITKGVAGLWSEPAIGEKTHRVLGA